MTKTPRGAPSPLRENPVFQKELAEMEGRLRSARAYLHAAADEIQAIAVRDCVIGFDGTERYQARFCACDPRRGSGDGGSVSGRRVHGDIQRRPVRAAHPRCPLRFPADPGADTEFRHNWPHLARP